MFSEHLLGGGPSTLLSVLYLFSHLIPQQLEVAGLCYDYLTPILLRGKLRHSVIRQLASTLLPVHFGLRI